MQFSEILGSMAQDGETWHASVSDSWLQGNSGHFGGVTNLLTVLKGKNDQGNPELQYALRQQTPAGFPYGTSTQGPSPISAKNLPGPFKSVFPGGWKEIAQR